MMFDMKYDAWAGARRLTLLLMLTGIFLISFLFLLAGCGNARYSLPSVNGANASLDADMNFSGFKKYTTAEDAFKAVGFNCRIARLTRGEKLVGIYEGPSPTKHPSIAFHYQTFSYGADRGKPADQPNYNNDVAWFNEQFKAFPNHPHARMIKIAGFDGMVWPPTYSGDDQDIPTPGQVRWSDGGLSYAVVAKDMNVTEDQLIKIAESMYSPPTSTAPAPASTALAEPQ